MALTPSQKEFLIKLSSENDSAFDDIFQNKIDFLSYKNQFLKDGTGIMQTLAYGYPKIKYIHALKHLSKNELSLNDHLGKKESALDILLSKIKIIYDKNEFDRLVENQKKHFSFNGANNNYKEDGLLKAKEYQLSQAKIHLPVLFDLFIDNNSLSNQQITWFCEKLYQFEFYDLYDRLIDNAIKDTPYFSYELLKLLIEKDDVNQLKKILSNFDQSIVTGTLFSTVNLYHEKSNLLSYCALKNSPQCFEYFYKNYDLSLNGSIEKTKQELTTYQTSVACLNFLILNNDKSSISMLFQNSHLDEIVSLFLHPNHLSINITFQHLIENNELFTLVDDYIQKHIDYLAPEEKRRFLELTLSSNADIEKIYKLSSLFTPQAQSENFFSPLINTYLTNIFNRPFISEEKNDFIINTVKIINKYHEAKHEPRYGKYFFQNIDLLEKLYDYNVDFFKAPLADKTVSYYNPNPLQYWLENQKTPFELQKNGLLFFIKNYSKEILEVSKEDTLLGLCLKNKSYCLIDLLSDEQLKLSLEKTEKNIFSHFQFIDSKQKKQAQQVFKRFFEIGVDFFDNKKGNIPLFFYLIKNLDDTNFFEEILNKRKITVSEVFNDMNAWNYVGEQNKSWIISQSLPLRDARIAYQMFEQLNCNGLINYAQCGGNVYWYDNTKNNLLHLFIKNKMYKTAFQLAYACPNLLSDINKQNKLPLHYLIDSFSKEIKDRQKIYHSNEKRLDMEILFEFAMTNGVNIKDHQYVENYYNLIFSKITIINHKPSYQNLILKSKLQSTIEKKHSHIHKQKI